MHEQAGSYAPARVVLSDEHPIHTAAGLVGWLAAGMVIGAAGAGAATYLLAWREERILVRRLQQVMATTVPEAGGQALYTGPIHGDLDAATRASLAGLQRAFNRMRGATIVQESGVLDPRTRRLIPFLESVFVPYQAILAAVDTAGYQPTGTWDDATAAAIERVQEANGLEGTGMLDAQTAALLARLADQRADVRDAADVAEASYTSAHPESGAWSPQLEQEVLALPVA
jgi:hypothetical protein